MNRHLIYNEIPGLKYFPQYINREEEEELIQIILLIARTNFYFYLVSVWK